MSEIFVVPPTRNIIKTVADDILESCDISSALVIFPHRRPALFLEYYLSQKVRDPIILPHIVAFEDWISEFFLETEKDPCLCLNEFDQAWLIYEAAKEVMPERVDRWEKFFPWALRMVGLIRELDLELIRPRDILYPPREKLPEKACEILERLGRIYESFERKLIEGSFTTQAKMIRTLAEEDVPLPKGQVYLVGFYALTRAEEKLFYKLFKDGAKIFWHAHPEDLPELYRSWKKRWGVEVKEIFSDDSYNPEIFFFEAHDLHAELKELRTRLPQKIIDLQPDRCAIVLLSPGSLIPLIHHLPEGPVNLTMGYPLHLTGIYVFLDTIFRLVLNKDEKRGYCFEDILEFLRSPYFKELSNVERAVVSYGAPYLKKEDLLELADIERPYLERLFTQIIEPLERSETPRDISKILANIFLFLQLEEGSLNQFEKEFLVTVLETVVPVLEGSFFAEVSMQKQELFGFVSELIASVRVPFEGEPLVGLQVMGLLETRLLSFEEIFFLDTNEGVIPAVEEVNPLLPQEVREVLGLPEREREEVIIRYHFERLLHTAKRVHLFYQFQTIKSGEAGFESKKIRSRYVERLIWEIEKKEKKLFHETSKADHFKASVLEIMPNGLNRPEPLPKDEMSKRLLSEKVKTFSPTVLNLYLGCPLAFFYERVLGLSPPKRPQEFEMHELGTAVHEALEEFYREATKDNFPKLLKKSALSEKRLIQLFLEKFSKKPMFKNLSPEKRFILEKTASFRLKAYLENQPEETTILDLEREYYLSWKVKNIGNLTLTGKIDRIDQRDGVYIVIDYKTGLVKYPSQEKLLSLIIPETFDLEGLKHVFEYLLDIQLPLYVYLFSKNQGIDPSNINAAFVILREKGEEKYLFNMNRLRKYKVDVLNRWFEEVFPRLLSYLICHIFEAPYWYPAISEDRCHYCKYKIMCRYSI